MKKLFLLEWKLCESRSWVLWISLWALASFMLLCASILTGRLLSTTVLPFGWMCVWGLPVLLFSIKVQVHELGDKLRHRLYIFALPVMSWQTAVPSGFWSVEVLNGRYSLYRNAPGKNPVHLLWRPKAMPVFLKPVALVGEEICR